MFFATFLWFLFYLPWLRSEEQPEGGRGPGGASQQLGMATRPRSFERLSREIQAWPSSWRMNGLIMCSLANRTYQGVGSAVRGWLGLAHVVPGGRKVW